MLTSCDVFQVVNLQYSEVQDRVMLTGRHMVRDVSCKNCNSKLGWIYEFATEDSQRYKEGRVILERALVPQGRMKTKLGLMLQRKKGLFFLGFGACVRKSDSKFHSKNYFEVNIAKENCSASGKFSSVFIWAYFRNGPNAAASVAPTLIRPWSGRFVFVMDLHSTLVRYPSTGLQEEKAGSDGPPLNIRGVLLHVLNDALGSVVVVVASALFYVWPLAPESPCNWQCYVDPSLTLVMVVIIMSSAVPLVKETAGILLQMSPVDLPLTAILEGVCKLPGVASVHEAHVWELAKGRNVASLHVKVSGDPQDVCWDRPALHAQIQQLFHRAGVHSVTVQLERADGEPERCGAPCVSPECLKLSCCPTGASTVCRGSPVPPSGDVTVHMLPEKDTENRSAKCTKF
uniref:Solute carrier family 30 member 10 n=1 Tax=Cyprinus carpio TaxID=7962 RepID=A0A8C1SUG0_CYPCA